MNAAVHPWPLRLLLVGAVATVALVHAGEGAVGHSGEASAGLLLQRAEVALTRAGFSLARHDERWQGTRAQGRQLLEARHPACAMPVVFEAVGALNPRQDQAATYFYGDHAGAAPGFATFLINALGMAWNHARHGRDTPRPNIKMLAAIDPSACLAITGTDWRWVWFGPDRAGAGAGE